MKVRIVVMSLIFVVAFMLAGCSGETDSANENRNTNNAATPSTDQATKTKLAEELKQAVTLLDEAKTELDQGTDETQAKAKRILGYPLFIVDDFSKPEVFVATLKSKTRGDLSTHLVTNFKDSTQKLLNEAKGGPPSDALLNALKDELNEQLKKELYTRDRFPDTRLTPATKNELKRGVGGRSPEELVYLNRLLLQDSYRDSIEPARGETVLSRLQNAESLAQKLSPSESPDNFQSKLIAQSNATHALLKEQSDDGAVSGLSSSDVSKVKNEVDTLRASLVRHDDPDKGDGWSIDQIVEVLKKVIYYLLLILAVLIPLAIISVIVKRARDNAAAKEHANVQAFNKLIDRNDRLQQEFTAFKNLNSSEINTLKDQVSRLESAYRILARKNDQYANSSLGNSQNINRYYEPPPAPVKEEPEFPVSAETYLEKMKGTNRFSTVIRPDFQNGILVKDSEGRGELVLIEDPTRPVDFQRLFVVPSVSQFQMKQDFYNYYDGYYECDQPAAGNVWIVHPAIVEKVNGGWRLTEKGRLEVRA